MIFVFLTLVDDVLDLLQPVGKAAIFDLTLPNRIDTAFELLNVLGDFLELILVTFNILAALIGFIDHTHHSLVLRVDASA